MMKVRFLGTGTSTGIPQIGCRCRVCTSGDERDKRLRASVRVDVDGKTLLIDCSPDFRLQVMPLPFGKIHGILFTHEHYDHVGGIDDLRPFSAFGAVNLYMEKHLENTLRERMPYCFAAHRYAGVPDIEIKNIAENEDFRVDGISVTPVRVMHHKLPILGYRIGDFAYLTDIKTVPAAEYEKLRGLKTLVVSALRKKEHISHQTLADALQMVRVLSPQKAYFTHLSHEMGLHADVERELPENVFIAYDGLEIYV